MKHQSVKRLKGICSKDKLAANYKSSPPPPTRISIEPDAVW